MSAHGCAHEGQNGYSPPSDEQLGSFIKATLVGEARRHESESGPFDPRYALKTPWMKEEWLRRHRELQEAINDAR